MNMQNMQNISYERLIEQVKLGYQISGLRKVKGCFFDPIKKECCPLIALAFANGAEPKSGCDSIKWAYKKFSVSWVDGFWQGVDGHYPLKDCGDWSLGYEMGRKVAVELKI